jgi:hypothetical protein
VFVANDAFAAVIDKDGRVLTDADFADPSSVPTIVADYIVDNNYYRGIYHDKDDSWEIVCDSDSLHPKSWVVRAGDAQYDFCERTVACFHHKLLSGPCPDTLRNRLVALINDLRSAGGMISFNHKPIVTCRHPNRKMTARWTGDDCKVASVILTSRYFNA